MYTAALLRVVGIGTSNCPQMVISCSYTLHWLIGLVQKLDDSAAPASEAIHWEAKRLDTRLKQENEYFGEPTPESDKAWESLIDREYCS